MESSLVYFASELGGPMVAPGKGIMIKLADATSSWDATDHTGDPFSAVLSRVLGRCHCLGNGTQLQYFCLENPMDGGAWYAAVHGVARVGHD